MSIYPLRNDATVKINFKDPNCVKQCTDAISSIYSALKIKVEVDASSYKCLRELNAVLTEYKKPINELDSEKNSLRFQLIHTLSRPSQIIDLSDEALSRYNMKGESARAQIIMEQFLEKSEQFEKHCHNYNTVRGIVLHCNKQLRPIIDKLTREKNYFKALFLHSNPKLANLSDEQLLKLKKETFPTSILFTEFKQRFQAVENMKEVCGIVKQVQSPKPKRTLPRRLSSPRPARAVASTDTSAKLIPETFSQLRTIFTRAACYYSNDLSISPPKKISSFNYV